MIDGIMERIGRSVPTQRKKIEKFFVEFPQAREELGMFLDSYRPYLQKENIPLELVVDSYLELVNQMMHSRLEFVRTGCYPSASQAHALSEVYRHKETMQQYMLGLALSYFLWRHQFQLLTFFRDCIANLSSCSQLLEVGCGHGLLLMELLKNSGGNIDVIDISRQSIDMTSGLLHATLPEDRRCRFFHCDIFDYRTDRRYDFITIGEVLEHVDRPVELLKRLAALLTPGGGIFVTTCANCPAIDHVYHFNNVREIKDVIALAGLEVMEEIVAPSEKKDLQYLEKNKVDISYAAMLRRRAEI